MGLSYDIISEFVKITNDNKDKPKEGVVYGVVAQTSNGKFVKIDGSDLITPAETTTEVEDGERVTIMIKNHTATITGNVSSPSASSTKVDKTFESISEKVGTFELLVADKISVNELEAYKATIEYLIAGKATIEDLEAINAVIENLKVKDAEIENLIAGNITVEDLEAINAIIENLKVKDAEIENAVIKNLESTYADINILNADFAQIRTLVNGNLTSDNIKAFNITADKVTMEDAFIKDAMVDNISAGKINAGKINTNEVSIGSEDGGMLITGSTQQFVDKNGKVRIQIGKDDKGDFTFVLYGEDGTGQLINQNGITASAIGDGLIVNDMVDDNAAISGSKLDISSVITEINNDNSTTIKSNKILLNEQNQSLEVAFNSLKTQVENIRDITVDGDLSSIIEQVNSNATEIEINKESINSLVKEDTTIKKQVSDLEGNIIETSDTLSSKYTELDQSLNGFKTTVADTYATKTTVNDLNDNLSNNYTTTSVMNSVIDQKVNEISSIVAKEEVGKIKIGVRNYILNSDVDTEISSLDTTDNSIYTWELSQETPYVGVANKGDIETFTLQIWYNGNVNNPFSTVIIGENNIDIDKFTISHVDTDTYAAVYKIEIDTDVMLSDEFKIDILCVGALGCYATIKKIQLERGTVASSFIAAPEDAVKNFNDTLDNTLESIVDYNQEIQTTIQRILSDDFISDSERSELILIHKEITAQYEALLHEVSNYNQYSYFGTFFEAFERAYNEFSNNFEIVLRDNYTEGRAYLQMVLGEYYDAYNTLLYVISQFIKSEYERMESEIIQTNDSITSVLTTVNDEIGERKKYMRFGEDGLELFTTINGQVGAFKVMLSENRLSFYENGNVVAYMSNNKLFISEAEVTTSLQIGKVIGRKSSNDGFVFHAIE